MSPGESFTVNVTATDQLGNLVLTVPAVKQIARNLSHISFEQLPGNEFVFSQQYAVLLPKAQETINVSLKVPLTVYDSSLRNESGAYVEFADSFSNFQASQNVDFEILDCHPGFYYDRELQTCACNTSIPGIERYMKYLLCHHPLYILAFPHYRVRENKFRRRMPKS